MTSITTTTLFKDKAVLGASILCVALGALLWWSTFGRKADADNVKVSTSFTHLHCPSCKTEMPYRAISDGKPCITCKSPYLPTVGSWKNGGQSGDKINWGKTAIFAIVSLILVECWAFVYIHRSRALSRIVDESNRQVLLACCPFCERKIQYSISRIGTGVICAKCKTAYVLPGE